MIVIVRWCFYRELSVYLPGIGCFLGDFDGGLDTVSEEVTLDVEYFGVIDQASDFRRGEMCLVKFLGRAQGGDERPATASAYDHLLRDGEHYLW